MAGFPIPDSSDPNSPTQPVAARGISTGRLAPAYVGRPGPVSAVGGLGIAAGCIGILVSIILLVVAVGLMTVSAAASAKAKQFAPQAFPMSRANQPVMLTITPAPVEAGPAGLPSAQREILLPFLQQILDPSPGQLQQLEALLREAGAKIFPPPAPGDYPGVMTALTDHGTTPSATRTASPTIFFLTAGGRALVYDDSAVFYPTAGTATVRTSAGPRLNATGHPILRPADVAELVTLIRQASGGKLNDEQGGALSKMLSAPDQQLVALTGPPEAQTLGISGAGTQSGGYVLVGFAGGPLLLSPNGQPIFAGDALPGVSVAACICVIAMALCGVAICIWLLVLSGRLLKQTLITPRLHRRWAGVKVAVSFLTGLSFGWMIATFAGSRPGAGSSNSTGIFAGLGLGLMGCVFPLVALALFKKRSARLYFDGVM